MSGNAIEIVAIGDELLLGDTVDTNTSWIARRIAREGFRVARVSTVGDDVAAIESAVRDALLRTRTVICTGGLGPTVDDLTRDVVARLYGRELLLNEAWLDELRQRYQRRGIAMPEINRVQALIPAGATMLPNARGTAPGIALDDVALGMTILLPGVPGEMRGLMEAHVVALLRQRLTASGVVESRVLRTTGITEAAVAERVADVVGDIAPLTIAFLPNLPGVDLRLTHYGAAPAAAAAAFERVIAALRERLGVHAYAEGDVDLATVVGGLLCERQLKVAVAESCTGGLLAKRLTDGGGASAFVNGGIVAYANDVKEALLHVQPETLRQHGAVSEQCAREMAEGARNLLHADVAVSITGVAGPGGGSEEKPVGLVWFALALDDALAQALQREPVSARRVLFPGDRNEVRERAAQAALDMIRRALQRGGD